MKRVLILSVFAVLCGASSALASSLAGTLTDASGDTVTVNYNVTSSGISGIDEVDFTVGSITGNGAAYIVGVSGGGVWGNAGGGVFSTTGGGYIGLSTSVSTWPSYAATNIGVAPTGFPVPGSWINLDSDTTGGVARGAESILRALPPTD